MHILKMDDTMTGQKSMSLFESLVTMSQQYSLDEIKISELCKNANVSRQFYYQHFSSKEEIVNFVFNQQYQHFLRIVQKYQVKDVYDMGYYFFQFFSNFRKPIQSMINGNLEYLIYYNFRDYFRDMLEHGVVTGHHKHSNYWSSFAAGGLMELLITWSQNENSETPEEMAHILVELLEEIH